MCEENVIEKLMSFNFVGIVDKVEEALAWKARHLDPRERPFWSLILYSWYVSRDDYRNGTSLRQVHVLPSDASVPAALVMYQRAAKLADVVAPADELLQLADMQREAYVTALNAMSLLEEKSAWIVVPVTNDNVRITLRRRHAC
jgi:nuclear pore complex protein Nup160